MEAPESLSAGTSTRPHTPREERRLDTLDQYDVLEAPPTEAFDRISRIATRIFDVPVALVNVIDRENQWSVSSCGLDLDRMPLKDSFCVHTIDQRGVLVVEDAREDERFSESAMVTDVPHVRFYAGAPITAPNGYQLGALCLLDDEPRSFSDDDRKTLIDLAGVVMDELNLRHYAAELDESWRAYQETSEQRRRILESITDAFVAIDEDWTLTYANAQAETLLERSRDALIGRNVWDEFPEAIGSRFQEMFETALEDDRTVEFTEYYEPLNRWLEVKAFPFEGGLSVYFDDVTNRMEAQESFRRERNLVEAILDTSVTALVIVNADGQISFANDPAGDILGADVDEITGLRHHDIGTLKKLDGTVIPVQEWPFQHVLETGTALSERRYVFERSDGTDRYMSVNAAPLRDVDGGVRQVVFSIDDITDQVQYEQELKAAKDEAEQASELKSAFLANVSHDVQTPLSSIMNHADLLRMELGDEHQDRIELIKRSSNRLRDTLESVLDLSKLEAGVVEPSLDSIDVADELLGTAEIFGPQAREKGLTLDTEVEEPLPATLDPTMLHRITDNLLGNAIKFTAPGGTVTLRAWGTEDEVVLEVEDNGVGIDDAFLPNLYEAFARGPDQSDTEGSGLGLAITKHLTDVLGGTIDVESEKEIGTRFTVHLPR